MKTHYLVAKNRMHSFVNVLQQNQMLSSPEDYSALHGYIDLIDEDMLVDLYEKLSLYFKSIFI